MKQMKKVCRVSKDKNNNTKYQQQQNKNKHKGTRFDTDDGIGNW